MGAIADEYAAIKARLEAIKAARLKDLQEKPVIIEEAPEPMALGLGFVRVNVD